MIGTLAYRFIEALAVSIAANKVGGKSETLFYKALKREKPGTLILPGNHNLETAFRVASIKATLVACNHVVKTEYSNWEHVFSRPKSLMSQTVRFLKKELAAIKKGKWIPSPESDVFHKALIEKDNINERVALNLLLDDLVEWIEWELKKSRIPIDPKLTYHLKNGWFHGDIWVSWFDTIKVCFLNAVESDVGLSQILQTKYLLEINEGLKMGGFEGTSVGELIDHFKEIRYEHEALLEHVENLIDELERVSFKLDRLEDGSTQIKEGIDELETLSREIGTDVEQVLDNTRGLKRQNKHIDANLNELNEKVGKAIEIEDDIAGLRENQNTIIETLKANHKGRIPHYITPRPYISDVFIGREAEMEELKGYLKNREDNNPVILVNGFGGIGKTSLAAQYFNNSGSDYSHLAWIVIKQSLEASLLKYSSSIGVRLDTERSSGSNAKDVITAFHNLAEGLDKPALLVLDNLNAVEDIDTRFEWLQGSRSLHVVITTRAVELSEFKRIIRINALSDNESVVLFRTYYPRLEDKDEQLILKLKEAVYANTLVLELLAKNLNEINKTRVYTLASLIGDLSEYGVFNLPQSRKVNILYHDFRKEEPGSVLRAMYDLARLDKRERKVLSRLSILPSETISFRVFETLNSDISELDGLINGLVSKGWIERGSSEQFIKCHPLVQETVLSLNSRLTKDCGRFLLRLSDIFLSDNATRLHHRDLDTYTKYALHVLTERSFPGWSLNLWILKRRFYLFSNENSQAGSIIYIRSMNAVSGPLRQLLDAIINTISILIQPSIQFKNVGVERQPLEKKRSARPKQDDTFFQQKKVSTKGRRVDDVFKEGLEMHHIVPDAGVWRRLSDSLSSKEGRVFLPWYYSPKKVVLAIVVLSILGLGLGYMLAMFFG